MSKSSTKKKEISVGLKSSNTKKKDSTKKDFTNSKKKFSKGKKILYIFIIVVLLLAYKYFFGCALKVPVMTQHVNDTKIDEKMVEVNVKKDTLSRTGLTLEIKNNTDMYLVISSEDVEYKMFGKWYMMVPKRILVSNLMANVVAPGKNKEIQYEWKEEYGRLSWGTYRIIISSFFDKERMDDEELDPIIERRDMYLSYEFKI